MGSESGGSDVTETDSATVPGGTVDTETETTFAQALDALKREGSSVLVVGADSQNAHETVCRRLAGVHRELDSETPETADSRGVQYRLRVTDTVDATASADSWQDCTNQPARTRTISTASVDRSRSGHTHSPESLPGEQPLIGTIGLEIIEAIDEFDRETADCKPAGLRLCLDSLVTLLDEHDTDEVFRLLHLVTTATTHARGVGHVHLPLDPDHDAVALLEPLFDALVELRTRDGIDEQRWTLRDRELVTEWMPVRSVH
ncbi:DUF7504 family protein [Natrialba taiwanensis]|uniref:Uncharacterized protein n=1 Tax=Natrialba taiwanensis DSM 12281 TaxID=1230458 RepID=L9ZKH7_9EURY|nr:hypothetical protein [Natrialba taiwanensis]ELY85703.1 hypothetical protein C484_20342 [Natrialba taiwanensis DSM 12281]